MKRTLLITALTILTISAGVTAAYYLLPIIVDNMKWVAMGLVAIFILMCVLLAFLSVYQWIEELISDYEWRKEREKDEKSRQEWLDQLATTKKAEVPDEDDLY
jgi:hypothetical protein